MTLSKRHAAAALSFLLLAAAPNADYRPYTTPQRLVDVGTGRRLNLYCTGTGSPTVILDTDQDTSMIDWRVVQPAISRRTQVCAYDAAGLGFSDPAPAPRDANAYMRDLHALLRHAHIEGPYVLVGYAFSGLSTRLFADKYMREVAGMVLVDPLVPYRNKQLAALVPALAPTASNRGVIEGLRTCRIAAIAHDLHQGTRQFTACMWPTGPADPALPAGVRQVLQKQWQRPGAWDDLIFAAEADDESSAEVIQEQRTYGAMPLVVLTSDVKLDLNDMPLPSKQKEAIARAYEGWHRQIASLSSRGTDVVVLGASSSNITVQHANSVISAINEVLNEVHATRK